MAVAWPGGVNECVLYTSYRERLPKNLLRSNGKYGPAIRRKETDSMPRTASFSLYMTNTEVNTFTTFYNTSTKSGTLAFDFTNPRTQLTSTYRFTAPPTIRIVDSGLNQVTMAVEELV